MMARVREDMKRSGITVSFLAAQLGVSRQYAWQAVRYRTPISTDRAREIAGTVDRIIAQRSHIRSFGEQLRAARIASGLTLKEVAGMIGYSWVGVERWEKDICRPKPGVLWHLFTLYGDSSRSIHQGMPPLAASAE
jgi:transcriptional regulator with XRE-family HTH domain